jgi:hypothetical protein
VISDARLSQGISLSIDLIEKATNPFVQNVLKLMSPKYKPLILTRAKLVYDLLGHYGGEQKRLSGAQSADL